MLLAGALLALQVIAPPLVPGGAPSHGPGVAPPVVHTDPATWRRIGVQGLRLGMGMEDVSEVLYGACTGPACGFTCRMQQHPPDTIDCETAHPRTRLEQGRLQVQWVRFTRAGGLVAFQLHFLGSSREDVASELDAVRKELVTLPPSRTELTGFQAGPELVSGFLDHAIVEAFLTDSSGRWELAVGLSSLGDPPAASDGADEPQP